jgi:hypothetical protein
MAVFEISSIDEDYKSCSGSSLPYYEDTPLPLPCCKAIVLHAVCLLEHTHTKTAVILLYIVYEYESFILTMHDLNQTKHT